MLSHLGCQERHLLTEKGASSALGEFGQRVRKARRDKNWTQKELANAIGLKAEDSVGAWETRGVLPPEPTRRAVAAALGVTYEWLTGSEPLMVRETDVDAGTYYQSALPTRRLPPRAYEVVYSYTQKLERAGLKPEEVEEAERFLVDGAYNKINAREPGDKTEDDLILDIKAAWQFVREVVNRNGVRV